MVAAGTLPARSIPLKTADPTPERGESEPVERRRSGRSSEVADEPDHTRRRTSATPSPKGRLTGTGKSPSRLVTASPRRGARPETLPSENGAPEERYSDGQGLADTTFRQDDRRSSSRRSRAVTAQKGRPMASSPDSGSKSPVRQSVQATSSGVRTRTVSQTTSLRDTVKHSELVLTRAQTVAGFATPSSDRDDAGSGDSRGAASVQSPGSLPRVDLCFTFKGQHRNGNRIVGTSEEAQAEWSGSEQLNTATVHGDKASGMSGLLDRSLPERGGTSSLRTRRQQSSPLLSLEGLELDEEKYLPIDGAIAAASASPQPRGRQQHLTRPPGLQISSPNGSSLTGSQQIQQWDRRQL